MKIEEVAHALTSPLNREIIGLLCDQDMTAVEVFSRLGDSAPKYRQSVNKALEKLKRYGLVRKYYDDTRKGLYYGVTKKRLVLNMEDMSIE